MSNNELSNNRKYPSYEDWEQDDLDEQAYIKGKIFAELYYMGLDAADFVEKFQCGPIAEKWDNREKTEYLCWDWTQSAPAFEGELFWKYHISIKKKEHNVYYEKLGCRADELDPEIIEWIGNVYEMWSRYSGMSSKEVYEKLDFFDMYTAWEDGEGADIYAFMKYLDKHCEDFQLKNRDMSRYVFAEKPPEPEESHTSDCPPSGRD